MRHHRGKRNRNRTCSCSWPLDRNNRSWGHSSQDNFQHIQRSSKLGPGNRKVAEDSKNSRELGYKLEPSMLGEEYCKKPVEYLLADSSMLLVEPSKRVEEPRKIAE